MRLRRGVEETSDTVRRQWRGDCCRNRFHSVRGCTAYLRLLRGQGVRRGRSNVPRVRARAEAIYEIVNRSSPNQTLIRSEFCVEDSAEARGRYQKIRNSVQDKWTCGCR